MSSGEFEYPDDEMPVEEEPAPADTDAAYPQWNGFQRERDFLLMGMEDPRNKPLDVHFDKKLDIRDNRDPQSIGEAILELKAEGMTLLEAANAVAGPVDDRYAKIIHLRRDAA